MNITTLTNKSSSARFFVLLTVASLVMTAFPVAFFVTEAAPAASVETIFFDGFESGDFTSWDADESPWAVDPAVGYGSPTSATISNTGGAKEIRKANCLPRRKTQYLNQRVLQMSILPGWLQVSLTRVCSGKFVYYYGSSF